MSSSGPSRRSFGPLCQTSTPSWTALTRQVALLSRKRRQYRSLSFLLFPLLLVLCALLVFVASAEICCCHCACPSVRSSCLPGGSLGVCSTACVCVQRSRPGERQVCPTGRQTSCETIPTQLAAHGLPSTRSFQRDDDHSQCTGEDIITAISAAAVSRGPAVLGAFMQNLASNKTLCT